MHIHDADAAQCRRLPVYYDVLQFMRKMCNMLRFEANTTAIASILFHRVYITVTFADQEPYLTGMACVFIAGKADDSFRKSRDVINVACSLMDPDRTLQIGDELFCWKSMLLEQEQKVLRLLRFQCHVDTPFSFLYNFCLTLFGYSSDVASLATSIMNDSLLTLVWVQFTVVELCCAALKLASTLLELELPFEADPQPLWSVFGVHDDIVEQLSHRLLSQYTEPVRPLRDSSVKLFMRDWKNMSARQRQEAFGTDLSSIAKSYEYKCERDTQQRLHVVT